MHKKDNAGLDWEAAGLYVEWNVSGVGRQQGKSGEVAVVVVSVSKLLAGRAGGGRCSGV